MSDEPGERTATASPEASAPSLFAELKRRRVFRAGAAYLVAAWLLVQVASVALPAFDAPPWAMRVSILVALLGFPFSVVLAWVFDMTPAGLRVDADARGTKRLVAGAGLLVVLAVGWYVFGWPTFRETDLDEAKAVARSPPAGAAPAHPVDVKSIAVLAFADMSPGRDQAWFSDGIAEEILNALAQ